MELSDLTGEETCRMEYLPEELKSQLCKWQEKSLKISPPPQPSANDKEVKYKLKSEMITDVFARVMRENNKTPRPPPGKWRKILEKPVFKHNMSGQDAVKQYQRLVTYRRQKRGEKIACTLRRLKKQQQKRNVVPSRYLQFPMSLEGDTQMEATGPENKYTEVKCKLSCKKRKKRRLNKVSSSGEPKNKERNMVQSTKLKENTRKRQPTINKTELSKEVENKTSQQDLHAASVDDKQLKKEALSKSLPIPHWRSCLSNRKPIQEASSVGLLLQIANSPQSSEPLMISKPLQINTETSSAAMIKKKAQSQSDICKTSHVVGGHKRLTKVCSIKKLNVINELRQKKHKIKLIYPSSMTVIPRENERHTPEAHTKSELQPDVFSILHDFHKRLTANQPVQNLFPKKLLTQASTHVPRDPTFVSKFLNSKNGSLIWRSHSFNNESVILPPINVDKNITSTIGDQRKFFKQSIFPDDYVNTRKWQQKSHNACRGTDLTSCLSVFGIEDVTQVKKYKSNKNSKSNSFI